MAIETDDPHATEDARMTASLAGLAVALLLLVVGLFLVGKLRDASNLQDCVMSGRTNCAPIATIRP